MSLAGLDLSGPAFFRKRNVGIGTLLLVIALVFVKAPLFPMLCAEEAETGKLRAVFSPTPDREFHVAFTHSVNRTRVREYYMLTEGGILLTRAEYTSFGAGMPEVPETPGATLSLKAGVLRLDHIDRPMPEFTYRVGTVAEHTLVIAGREIPFENMAPPQTALRFRYRNITAYEWLRRFIGSE